MKQLFFYVFVIAITFSVNAQTKDKVVLGNIDIINSKILNEEREIWVYVPNSGANENNSGQHFPVAYLLDGSLHFYSVAGMIRQLSTSNGNTVCPQMIVVGILNTDRTRDLTPSHNVTTPAFSNSTINNTSGGGAKFMSFIEKELIPHIDSLYPTTPYRMLIGHSLGGLMAINTLIHNTGLFNSYVAIDPSMWWDNKKVLNDAKTALAENKYKGVSLFLGIANTMAEGMDTIKVKEDTSIPTRHIRSILELNNLLNSNKQNQLKYKAKYYSTDNHTSVPLIAEYDALHFIFDYYRLNYTFDDFTGTSLDIAHKIEKHYETISDHFGYKVIPPEGLINFWGYSSLRKKQYARAEYFFKLNIKNYPNSFNVYDSYGDYCRATNDTENAITNYEKALSINENKITRQKLEKLQNK